MALSARRHGKATVDDESTAAALAFIEEKRAEGTPLAIETRSGKHPIFAAGNSDGDFHMLDWTTTGDGPHFGTIVHHTDAEREWANDRASHIGRHDRGLDAAVGRDWLLVEMAKDWEQVWPDPR